MNNKFNQDAADALTGYVDRRARLVSKWRALNGTMRYPAPRPSEPIAGVWAPTMTEQQRKEHEQYVIENRLPF